MSLTSDVVIDQNIADVWAFIRNPEQFAQIFFGVSEIDKIPEEEGRPEQVVIKGKVAGFFFSSSLVVEERDDTNKQITYKSGRTRVKISLEPENNGTKLRLTFFAYMQSVFFRERYVKSMIRRIEKIFGV